MHHPFDKVTFMRKILSILACCLLQIWFAQSVSGEDDQVYLTRGAPISGQVNATTPAQVTIESRGQNQTVNVNEIRLITFGDEPQELRQGRAGAIAGRFESALDDLERVNPASIERELVKRDLQFYLALCEARLALSAGGDKAKAAELMFGFVRAAPTNFHFFEAAGVLGDLAVGQGDYESAVKYYGAIASKAPWPEYKMGASLSEARALVAQGKFAAAQQKFESVIEQPSDAPETKRQKLLAEVGKARCLAETGSPAEGIKLLEKVIGENEPTDNELFGRAYNAQGDCLLKAGKQKDALMAYLHVDVLFYSDPEIHAESLYHLSKLWAAIKKPDRAASARNMLDQRYSGSVWAKQE
jgi:tetratricopeptide (TPR) repeat protein